MAEFNTYIINDPLDALFLKRRYGLRLVGIYASRAAGKEISVEMNEQWLIDMLTGRGLCASKIYVHQEGLATLARLGERLVAGLKYFNILPQEMAAL